MQQILGYIQYYVEITYFGKKKLETMILCEFTFHSFLITHFFQKYY